MGIICCPSQRLGSPRCSEGGQSWCRTAAAHTSVTFLPVNPTSNDPPNTRIHQPTAAPSSSTADRCAELFLRQLRDVTPPNSPPPDPGSSEITVEFGGSTARLSRVVLQIREDLRRRSVVAEEPPQPISGPGVQSLEDLLQDSISQHDIPSQKTRCELLLSAVEQSVVAAEAAASELRQSDCLHQLMLLCHAVNGGKASERWNLEEMLRMKSTLVSDPSAAWNTTSLLSYLCNKVQEETPELQAVSRQLAHVKYLAKHPRLSLWNTPVAEAVQSLINQELQKGRATASLTVEQEHHLDQTAARCSTMCNAHANLQQATCEMFNKFGVDIPPSWPQQAMLLYNMCKVVSTFCDQFDQGMTDSLARF